MKENGQELAFTKETFINCDVRDADISALLNSDMDDVSFIETAYFGFLYRLPDENEKEIWIKKASEISHYEFKKELIAQLSEMKKQR